MSIIEEHANPGVEIYDPNKDYTHTPESQQAFQDGVEALRVRLESDIFTPETTMLHAPTQDSLTLDQVREIFFVKELEALRNATLWQSDKHLATPPQEAMENGHVRVNASVNKGLVDVVADVVADVPSQIPTDLPFVRGLLTEQDGAPGQKIYDLSLYGGYRGGNLAPNTLTGRYVQGPFRDRVSLTYPDGRQVKKTFRINSSNTPRDVVTPPVLRTK